MSLNYNKLYRTELATIKKVIELNKPQLFLTLRDLRPQSSYRKFRQTDSAEEGYAFRMEVMTKVIGLFRRAYKITDKDFFWYACHESGVSRDHVLLEDRAHLHCMIGFTPRVAHLIHEPYLSIEDFFVLVKGGESKRFGKVTGAFRWLDLCFTFKNVDRIYADYFRSLKEDYYSVRNPDAIGEYMSKPEAGILNGMPFFKKPFGGGSLILPQTRDLEINHSELL